MRLRSGEESRSGWYERSLVNEAETLCNLGWGIKMFMYLARLEMPGPPLRP